MRDRRTPYASGSGRVESRTSFAPHTRRDEVGPQLDRARQLLALHLLARRAHNGHVLVPDAGAQRVRQLVGPARLSGLEAGREAVSHGDVGGHAVRGECSLGRCRSGPPARAPPARP